MLAYELSQGTGTNPTEGLVWSGLRYRDQESAYELLVRQELRLLGQLRRPTIRISLPGQISLDANRARRVPAPREANLLGSNESEQTFVLVRIEELPCHYRIDHG